MKRLLFSLAFIGASLFPIAPRARAQDEASLDIFYDNLSSQGSWFEVGDYGYCFQPTVAEESSNWRPYTDGYWAYTDYGWTWVSYEDFGWATYHYGRWTELEDYGWVWVPGYEWAPAWVSWRTGGDYIGWAPLPPDPNGVYEGRSIDAQADVEFDIGPAFYNFVDIRYIGAPVLRDRIVAPAQNVTIVNTTVNVTNITYKNATIYNYGPDFNRVNRFSANPIQRLKIQRESTTSLAGPAGHNLNRVKGSQLMVVAPRIQKSAPVAPPKNIKSKIAQPKLQHGWQGVANREQVEAQMKNQSPKNIRAPTFQPARGHTGNATPAPNPPQQPNERQTSPPDERQIPPVKQCPTPRPVEKRNPNNPPAPPLAQNPNQLNNDAAADQPAQPQSSAEENNARENQQRIEDEKERAARRQGAEQPHPTQAPPTLSAAKAQQRHPSPGNARSAAEKRKKNKENEQSPAPQP